MGRQDPGSSDRRRVGGTGAPWALVGAPGPPGPLLAPEAVAAKTAKTGPQLPLRCSRGLLCARAETPQHRTPFRGWGG